MRKKRVKIDLQVQKEIKELGLFIDSKQNIWQPPFIDSRGRLFALKQIKPFSHNNEYLAIQVKNRIYSINKALKMGVDVSYKKIFEINIDAVPDNVKKFIVAN